MRFYKYQGTGNDFIISENLDGYEVKWLCDNHYGVGADGVILVEDIYSDVIDIKIYNKDGSEAKVCGNGLRCVSAYLKEKLNKNKFKIRTISGIYKVNCIDDEEYEVEFSNDIKIEKVDDYYLVNTGNDHVFTICDKDFNEFVSYIKDMYDSNIEKVNIIDKNNIEIRVHERGVGETLACGSACIAIISTLYKDKLANKKVNCYLKGGLIQVRIKGKYIYLRGNAKKVYKGEI